MDRGKSDNTKHDVNQASGNLTTSMRQTYLAVWAVPGVGGEPAEGVGDLGALTLATRKPQLPQAANDGRVRLAAALPTEEVARTAVHRVRNLTCEEV